VTAKTGRPVALVTGGHRGIGLAIAHELAKAGYHLAIADIADAAKGEAALSALWSHGVEAIYRHTDLRQLESHDQAVRAVLDRFGRIDCLVNNAGIASVARGDFLDLEPANFDTVIDINLKGTIFFTQSVVKAMLASGAAGHPRAIITITSVSAELSSPERLDYCISKAGLAAFTQGLALRLAETGIMVFEVRPGIIRTDMTASVSAKYDARIEDGLVPMKRWGEPGDIGRICAALAGGDFAFATGATINADGGLSIPRL
jgi:3-oxoacyl-[acyl-carrier protein] reductase